MQENPLPLFTRFAQGVFWTISGSVASRLFTFSSTLIVARLLAKVGFGQLGMIQSTIGLLGVFAGFGIGITATKYISELKLKDPPRVGRIIALSNCIAYFTGGIATLACYFAAPWLAANTLNAPELAFELKLGSVLLLVSAISGVQFGSLSGFQAFRTLAKINFWQGLLSLPITIPFVYFLGLRGAILSLILSTLMSLFFSSWALRLECNTAGIKVKLREAWSERHILWRYSLPATLSAAMVVPVGWAANALLVNQLNGYSELGLFNAANQFRLIIMFIPNIIALVAVPLFSEIQAQGSQERFAHALNLNLRVTWFFALALGFSFIAFGKYLIMIFGSGYNKAIDIFPFIIIISIIYLPAGPTGQALTGAGKMWTGFLMNSIWGVVLMGSGIFLIPHFGAIGLALSYIFAYACMFIYSLFYIARAFGSNSVKSTGMLAFFTLIAVSLALITNHVSTIVVGSAGIASILAMCLLDLKLLHYLSGKLRGKSFSFAPSK